MASTGPRSHERGRWRSCSALSTGTPSLQRGRALTSAEGSSPPSRPAPRNSLQRGRALTSAEGFRPLKNLWRIETLQRGRALTSAEGSQSHDSQMASKAASTGPRSHERGRPARVRSIARSHPVLQRGRALTSAEGFCIRRAFGVPRPASTGPRSHERGRLLPQVPPPPLLRRFNGAALSRARKVRPLTFSR